MKLKSFSLLVILWVAATNFQCNPACQAALADLTSKIVYQGTLQVLQVTAGEPFDLTNLVNNLIETGITCKDALVATEDAGETETRLKIDYDEAKNGTYTKNEKNNNYGVMPIPAGAHVEDVYTSSFNEPGDYRIVTYCDDKDQQSERNEDNNASGNLFGKSGRLSEPQSPPLIIHVLPNPNFTRRPDQPFVEILSRRTRLIQ